MSKLLIVDDELDIREFAKSFFKKRGIDVLTASGGGEALEIIENEKPDLVLLDIIMPDMNGEEVYMRMRDIQPDVKVLVSSGYSIDWQARQMLENGCNGFIQKPFKIEALSFQIREALSS